MTGIDPPNAAATTTYATPGTIAKKTAPIPPRTLSGKLHAFAGQGIGESAESAQVELFRTDLRIDAERDERSLRPRTFDAERERETVSQVLRRYANAARTTCRKNVRSRTPIAGVSRRSKTTTALSTRGRG